MGTDCAFLLFQIVTYIIEVFSVPSQKLGLSGAIGMPVIKKVSKFGNSGAASQD
jgi:hypothetical protein